MTSDTSRAASRSWLPWALAALVPWAVGAWMLRFTCDDAYISFRYAANLLAGAGLAYNPGESPPVEGYSNFLWTLISAAALAVRADPAIVANVVSAASGAALLLLVARFARVRVGASSLASAAAAAFTGLLPPMQVWATSGLETMSFALCVFLVYERIALEPGRPRGLQAGVCAALAALLRADGAGWAAAALVVAAIDVGWRAEQRAALLRAALVLGAVFCAHLAWRHAYYGEWIPNTARVKAGLSALRLERGAKYVASFLVVVPSASLPPILAFATARTGERGVARAVLAMPAITIGYALWTGGDFLPFGRFFLPALPFAGIAFALVVVRRRVWSTATGIVLAAFAPLSSFGIQATPAELHFRWNEPEPVTELETWRRAKLRAEEWTLVGRALGRRFRGESIVLGGIGAVGYYSGLCVFDLFGLVSPEVARLAAPPLRASPGHDRRVDPEFFLGAKPTFLGAWISPTNAPLSGMPAQWRALVALELARVERYPPGPDEGFPPGTELRVLRFVYDP